MELLFPFIIFPDKGQHRLNLVVPFVVTNFYLFFFFFSFYKLVNMVSSFGNCLSV